MNIRDYLKKVGKTVTEFASDIGVTHSAVVKYTSGKSIPRPEIMQRIANTTDGLVTANDFYAQQKCRTKKVAFSKGEACFSHNSSKTEVSNTI